MLDLWWALLPAYFTGLLAVSLIEVAIKPRPRIFGRTLISWRVNLGIWTLFFAAELLLWQRPWFATANGIALMSLLVVISNIKQGLMREPFVYMDFEYFTDLLRHPRLYLPYFGVWRAVVLLGLFCFAVYLGLVLETSLFQEFDWSGFITGVAFLLLLAGLILRCDVLPMTFDANTDLQRHGFLTSLWAYGLAEYKPARLMGKEWKPLVGDLPTGIKAPHMVLVQSESFFDARAVHESIDPEVYAWWDQIQETSRMHGSLEVPALGANTVRTEFAVLSGLREAELGVYRFNPYRKLDFSSLSTLPQTLRQAGYRTICIHPYPAGFYRRDRVFPSLGFDEFIDIQAFDAAPRFGPYVSDVAVAEKVASLLEKSEQPLFVFVITMENHGPLHYEQVTETDRARYYNGLPPAGFDDMTVYLRHIENAGIMCRKLQVALNSSDRPGRLCWYGDHVPIMPNVYKGAGYTDSATNFVVWHSGEVAPGIATQCREKLQAHELGLSLLGGVT
ncbi:MAG: LTA synthase family protein [Gammaproteobacteria bacterium]|nr:LTA synthase family protein [Gammaproteobacteria bacterium]